MDSKPDLSDSDPSWYTVHCQTNREVMASRILNNLGMITFVPQINKKNNGGLKAYPLFPGYIFIQTNIQHTSVAIINRIPGVLKVIEFGDGPVIIAHTIINAIDEELQRMNDLQEGYHIFRLNDLVSIRSGPLQGFEAIFMGPTTPSKRVRVLLNFLGNLKEAQLDVENLRKVTKSPVQIQGHNETRERYTRGRGRKVSKKGAPHAKG